MGDSDPPMGQLKDHSRSFQARTTLGLEQNCSHQNLLPHPLLAQLCTGAAEEEGKAARERRAGEGRPEPCTQSPGPHQGCTSKDGDQSSLSKSMAVGLHMVPLANWGLGCQGWKAPCKGINGALRGRGCECLTKKLAH